ncbi:MAG: radical SAM protein [Tahibacter sp.]
MRKPLSIPVRVEMAPVADTFDARLERIAAPLRQWDEAAVRAHFGMAESDRLLKTTLSLCQECLAHVIAAVYERDGRVWLDKQCAQHGHQHALLENDTRFYRLSNKDRWGRAYAADRVLAFPAFDATSSCCGPSESCATPSMDLWPHDFAEQSGNKSCTVLVEITDACNLACRVCYAESAGDRVLPLEQFKTHLSALIAQKGMLDSVQVTGGEASLHPQFWDMLHWLAGQAGVGKIYLPTNGIEFGKRDFAEKLVALKDRILVLLQFDGTDRPTNQTLRRASPERLRIKLIERLNTLGIAMQLTMTLTHGVSERDIAWVVKQGRRYRNVRLIAMQPAFFSGRYELDLDTNARLTLSDCVKGVVAGMRKNTREDDFLPIPCSHPNCGWVTLYARRFGFFANIARHVDLNAVMNEVAYKTLLKEREMQNMVGTKTSGIAGWLARIARRLIRPQDVFGIAIKPFMDRFNYDQDRISNCCHHMTDTHGRLVSFCEYNARLRRADSWQRLPVLDGHRLAAPDPVAH